MPYQNIKNKQTNQERLKASKLFRLQSNWSFMSFKQSGGTLDDSFHQTSAKGSTANVLVSGKGTRPHQRSPVQVLTDRKWCHDRRHCQTISDKQNSEEKCTREIIIIDRSNVPQWAKLDFLDISPSGQA